MGRLQCFQKASISFVMSVRPSVCTEQLDAAGRTVMNCYIGVYSDICQEYLTLLKVGQYKHLIKCIIQGGARKTGPPSRRPTWA